MTPNQIQQFNMLQDVITEFSDNPDQKRSTNNSVACTYNPSIYKPLSKGCAIGMYLPAKLAIKLDGCSLSSIDSLMEYESELLPTWLLKMNSSFLSDIQTLHDNNSNWRKKGLTDVGVGTIRNICKNYELPFHKLKFN